LSDTFRIFTLLVIGLAACGFPYATILQGRRWDAYLAVAGAELLMIGMVGAIVNHFGDPIVWYRTPVALVGGALILAFVILVLREGGTREGQ
jgi:peptidoglycan/LPS O-acetylase OafA/YrhL